MMKDDEGWLFGSWNFTTLMSSESLIGNDKNALSKNVWSKCPSATLCAGASLLSFCWSFPKILHLRRLLSHSTKAHFAFDTADIAWQDTSPRGPIHVQPASYSDSLTPSHELTEFKCHMSNKAANKAVLKYLSHHHMERIDFPFWDKLFSVFSTIAGQMLHQVTPRCALIWVPLYCGSTVGQCTKGASRDLSFRAQ